MATESSAVVRFINTVQQSRSPELPSLAPDVTMRFRQPRRGLTLSVTIAAGCVLVGAAVATGFVLAKRAGAAEGEAPTVAAAPAPSSPQTPAPAAALVPSLAEPASVTGDVAKETGFDIRVEPPGAVVSLDGKEIGRAPLRVRNLLPGEHQVGVAGPDGYFGQHMVVVLAPGVAQELSIELELLDDEDLVASAAADDPDDAEADDAEAAESAESVIDDAGDSARAERRAKRRAKRRARRRARRDTTAARASGATGLLMLGSKPPCDIYIDGRATGKKTPQRELELVEGSHTITLINRQHGIKKRFKVRISAGKTTRAIQDLTSRL